MISISEVIVFVLDGSRGLRKRAIADIVHFFGDFARRTQRTVTFFNTITDVVIIVSVAPTFVRTPFAFVVVIAIPIITMVARFSPLPIARLCSASAAAMIVSPAALCARFIT